MTKDGRESQTFISYRLAYLPVRFPNDVEMDSYPKMTLTPDGECNPSDIDDYVQWHDSDNDVSFGANVSANSYTW